MKRFAFAIAAVTLAACSAEKTEPVVDTAAPAAATTPAPTTTPADSMAKADSAARDSAATKTGTTPKRP